MATSFIVPFILIVLLPELFSGLAIYMLSIVPVLGIIFVFLYPLLKAEGIKHDIDANMHFYITHIGILATSDSPPADLFRVLSAKDEYGTIAKACGEIYMRFAVWHVTLSDSCRLKAKTTPSIMLADFLDRFANALDAGEVIETFLLDEQNYVMNDYSIKYKGALYDIDVLKEIYLSIVITLVFLISFAIIIPYLTGIDSVMLMLIVVTMFISAEIGVIYYIKSVLPNDPVWYKKFANEEMKRELMPAFVVSCIGSLIVSIFSNYFLGFLPLEILVAVVVTPFLIVGYIARTIEEQIKRRDQFFVEFIISLGLGASARGGVVLDSLKALTFHDFGELTQPIRDLYERLKTRINNFGSWFLFRVECGSFLINKFTEMFVETLKMGGKPDKTSEVISKNFMTLLMLRRQRYHSTTSFIGIVYGIQAVVAFCLYVSAGVVKYMNGIYSALDVSTDVLNTVITLPEASSMEVITVLLIFTLVMNALLSAIAIRLMDGGSMLNSMVHFVMLVWIGGIIGLFSQFTLDMLLPLPEGGFA
ncbi:MAG: type II secretion system F family protein [Candidatus Micrarchaeota archaeon]